MVLQSMGLLVHFTVLTGSVMLTPFTGRGQYALRSRITLATFIQLKGDCLW